MTSFYKIIATVFLLTPVLAHAQWVTNTEDDIFNDGKKATLIGTLKNTSSAIVFDCTKKELGVSYIEKDDTSDVSESSSVAEIVFKIDKNPSVAMDGSFSRRNDQYIAIAADDGDKIKTILRLISDAKGKVLIGIQGKDGGNQASFTGNASNSTNAVNKFVSACDIKL